MEGNKWRASGSDEKRDRLDGQMAMRIHGKLQLTGWGGDGHFQEETELWCMGGAEESVGPSLDITYSIVEPEEANS